MVEHRPTAIERTVAVMGRASRLLTELETALTTILDCTACHEHGLCEAHDAAAREAVGR